MPDFPRDDLVRAVYGPGTISMRAKEDGGTGRTMFGHAAVFDQWTEIDSWFEGPFMERIAPGAFAETLKRDAKRIRVMYAHGQDYMVGAKPIGAPDVLREDATGLYYESELFRAAYADQLLEPLQTGQLGASFRFTVDDESIHEPKKATASNPGALVERTITAVSLFEIGPCPWGAYDGATAGVRSLTAELRESWTDPLFIAQQTEHLGLKVVEKILANQRADGRRKAPAETRTDGGDEAARTGTDPSVARARMRLALL